ncbi:MaoC/PaaZ C-terminal domain-containing protein [Streptomyces sp. NPDC051976]|uniref:MaoC/PaaZ C-terminal domain-containing protein n=1 Tax=Streptomyces sp. NPDC051976 TaxID=3154947 RepID=UPI003421E6DB
MPLLVTLGRGVLTGVGKRPSPAAALPPVRLTRPDVTVDPDRLAAYARVCGHPAAGPLPLTYPHILGFPLTARIMAARTFPLPLLGLVHTSIDIVAHHRLTAGDRPELAAYAAGLRPHPRGTEVVMIIEARLDGKLAWTDRSTYLARHAPRTGPVSEAGPVSASEPASEAEPVSASGPVSANRSGPSPASGPLPRVAEWALPADLGRRHARVSGDYNPIHLYPLTARPLGFPRAIAHGMWTVARCAAESPAATRISAVFHKPILLPATVGYGAAGDRFEVRSGDRLHVSGAVGGSGTVAR